ncbi:branched-chain amino acid transport system permease protein [Thermocatellispora tengchongensis]|uniref:Branched-chain amino acid transport system permease protein n=1 Tax=Thermocatellispora tengchongensis TaxID=1073253 RepID=A0A840P6J0_9ACTN|nr:branched-chain amino acid ABC transporter permease [Thermocatellispora tengchongensis]MBB5133523.1 branched-chain amino acid transport system permease protein [Thermocatellispora tengchongensis]
MTGLAQTLAFGVLVGGVYALAASAMNLIFGVMRIVNLAQGAMLMLGAYLAYSLWRATGLDPLLLTLVTAPALLAVGWVTYYLFVERARTTDPPTALVTTFGLALITTGVIALIWGNEWRLAGPGYAGRSFTVAGLHLPQAQVYACLVAAVVLGGLWLVLNRTWLGRSVRAVAAGPEGARLVGIDVRRVWAASYALGVAAAGAGGALLSVLYPFTPSSGYHWIGLMLSIVVLGGMGSMAGSVLGAVLVAVGEALTSAYLSPGWATAVPYLVIVIVLLARPQGLLGARLREDMSRA